MKQEILFVRSLEDYLETQIQPILKNPRLLKIGKPFTNIKLRPREVLGAFVVCTVIRFISNQNWTLARDPDGGDGVILCIEPSRLHEGACLEQVYVPNIREESVSMPKIIEMIQKEVEKKHNKGTDYAKNRHLIIFLDVEGLLDYQKVKTFVNSLEERFDSYWLFATAEKAGEKFSYLVFLIRAEKDEPAAYSVKIRSDFKSWEVQRLGRI